MKALSIRQPYASLIMIGAKPYEYRSKRTTYRGRIAVHAAKSMGKDERAALKNPETCAKLRAAGLDPNNLPRACILGTVELSGCDNADDLPYPHSRAGVFAWSVVLPRVFAQPVPAKGALSFWDWDETDVCTLANVPALNPPASRRKGVVRGGQKSSPEIDVELTSPNGPRIEYGRDHDTADVCACAPAGYDVDFSKQIKLASGRFRAPLVKAVAPTLWKGTRP